MSSPFCSILFLLSSIVAAPLAANAETAEEPTAEGDTFFDEWLRGDDLLNLNELGVGHPDEVRDLETLPAPSAWEGSAKLSAGVGYRDNVLLSPSDPKGGGFLLGGLESSLLRLSERLDLTFFLDIEHLEFDRDLPSDTFASFYSLGSIDVTGDKTINIATRALWIDQVVEVATRAGTDERMRIRSSGVDLIPSLRKDWANSIFSETFLLVSRTMSQEDEVSDYWEVGPRISAGWSPANSELTLSLAYFERHFDDRRAFTAEGVPLENTQVKFRRVDSGAAFRHEWGENRQWHSNSWLGLEFNRDNETDYFSYNRIRASQQISYQLEAWEFAASIRYSHYSYEVQRTSPDGPRRRRELWGGSLEIRRDLTSQLEVFGRYERDAANSNDRADVYEMNTWTVGLGWQF